MSQSIDTKIVELKFNNDNFAEKVDSTLKKLHEMNKAIDEDGLSNALKNLGKNAKKVEMKGVTEGVQEASKSFSKLEVAGITALANISNAAVNLGKKLVSKLISPLTQGVMAGGLSRARNIEQATFQFEGLKIDKSDPTLSYYDEVMQAVLGTSYSYDVAAKAASQLAASNIGVKETTRQLADGTTIASKVMTNDMTKALLGIAGVASMTGSDFDSISQIFTRVAGQGKVMAQDLNSIASRGLNAAAVLADSLNTTEGNVRDMVSKGEISFEEFSKAMSDAYGAHAKDSTLMFQGALDDVNAALARIGADFYGPALKAGRDILNSITPVVDAVHNKLAPVLSKSGSFIDSASKSLSQYLDMLAYLVERFPKGREAMGDWIAEHMNAWTNISDLYGRGDFKAAVNGLSDFMAQVEGMDGVGIDGWQMLADYLHITKEEAIQLGNDGSIGFNTFYKAFRQLWSQSEKLTNIAGITKVFDDYVREVIRAQDPTEKFNKHVEVFFSIIKGAQSLFNSATIMFGGLVDIFVTLAHHLAPLGHLVLDLAKAMAKFTVDTADFLATSRSFNTVIDGVVALINELFSLVNISKIAALTLKGIGKVFDFISSAIDKIDAGFTKVFNAIHNFISRIIEGIKNIVGNTELLHEIFEDLKHAGMIVAIVNMIGALTRPMDMLKSFGLAVENVGSSFSKMIKQVGKVFDSIAGMFGKVGKVIDEITNTLKRMQELLVATAILEIAVAIGVLAAALYLLSKVHIENASDQIALFINVATVASTMLAATKVLSTITSKAKIWERSVDSIKGIGFAMIEFAASLAIMAGAVYMLAKLDKKQLLYATGAVEALLITLTVMAKLLSGKTTKSTGLKALWSGEKTTTNMTKGLLGLVAMAEAVNILATALNKVATIQDPYQIAYSLGAIEVLLVSLFGITKLLSGPKATKMAKGATMLLAMAVAVKLLTKPVLELASLNSDAMTQGVLGVGGIIVALGALMKVVSGTKGAIKTAAGILILSLAIKSLEGVVIAFSGMDGEGLVKGLGSVIGLIFGLGMALNFIDADKIIGKALGLILVAASLKVLEGVITTFSSDPGGMMSGLLVMAGALMTLYFAVEVFNSAPIGGILKLFGTLVLGAIVVAAFGAAIGVLGIGIGIFSSGLNSFAATVERVQGVAGTMVGILIGLAIAIGVLASVGLPAIAIILAISAAFLLLGVGMTLMGQGMDSLAGAIKIITDLKGELGGTAKELGSFVKKLSSLSEESSKAGDGFTSISEPLEKIKGIAETITGSIEKLTSKYTEMLNQTASSMNTLSSALTVITQLSETSMTRAAELITNFIDTLKNMSADTQAISTLGQGIADSMNIIQLAIQSVIDTIGEFSAKSVAQFTAMGESLQSIVTPLKVLDNMRIKLQGLSDSLVSFFSSLSAMKDNASVVEEGSAAITSALAEVSNAANAMKTSFSNLTSATATTLTNIGSGLINIAEGAKGMVEVKDTLDSATDTFSRFYSKLAELSGTAAVVAQGTNTISAAVRGLGDAAAKAASLSAKGMIASGEQITSSLAKGILSKKSEVGDATTTIVDYAATQADSREGSFYDVGSNLIAGMISGINSQMGSLEAAVQALESKAERAVKAKAKIKSPSRVWMQIGSYMGEGLAIGIGGASNKVVDASEGLAIASEDAVSAAIRSINNAVEEQWNDGPVITPIVDLSNIQQGAAFARNAFNSNSLGLNGSYGIGLARSINNQIQNRGSLESTLGSLADQLGSMTDTMNSRSLNNYINISGNENPDAFADALTRRFKLNARTI